MTDRELLELAAKAAGMHLTLAGYIKNGDKGNPVYSHPDYKWNPLADDGDALRLAVKLEIAINPFAGKTVVANDESKRLAHEKWDCHDDDPYAATRRAIVRVAAEIGSAMR